MHLLRQMCQGLPNGGYGGGQQGQIVPVSGGSLHWLRSVRGGLRPPAGHPDGAGDQVSPTAPEFGFNDVTNGAQLSPQCLVCVVEVSMKGNQDAG